MKLTAAVVVLILLGVGVATAQWKKGDERIADSPDRKSVEGFGGHLIIVKDPRAFVEEWEKPEMPKIDIAKEATRGPVFGAFVLFAGCKPDAQGVCNAEVDYAVYKPDGSLYAEQKGQPLWKDPAPPVPNIQLSRAILAIRFEKQDPAGDYKVTAKVSDLNAKVSFDLETKISLK